MQKVISKQSFLGSTDIGAIQLDAKSRNDIPALPKPPFVAARGF